LNDVEAATPPAPRELGEVQRGKNSSWPREGRGSGACLTGCTLDDSASGASGLKRKWLEVEKELRAIQALRTPKDGSEAKKLVGDFLVCLEEACEVYDDVASRESPQSRRSVAKREASFLNKWSDSGKIQNELGRLSAERHLLRKESEARIGHTKPTPQHLHINQVSDAAVAESMSGLQSENEKISAQLAEIRSETSAIRIRLFSQHPTLLELEEHEAILEKRTRHLEALSESSGIL
ncbi:hypothetical protein FOZ63_030479, partial [Perkinsus olseni]